MTTIGLFGVNGRMTHAISSEAPLMAASIAGCIGRDGSVQGSSDTARALAEKVDVLIDFTLPAGLSDHLRLAMEARRPLLIGTTGLTEEDHATIEDAAKHIAIIQTYNTSLGIAMLSHLVREAASRLGPEWDIEIMETHHRNKIDAPSGTALLLGQAAAEGRGSTSDQLSRFDRIGFAAHAREHGTIGYASLRGGSVAGEHMVMLATDDERLELVHRAENRRIFARGAIRAGQWLVGKAPGLYTMGDVLGL